MKSYSKITLLAIVATFIYSTALTDTSERLVSLVGLQLVSDAHAIAGVRRRTHRRSLAVGYSAGKASAASAATAATVATTEPAPAAPAPAPAPAQPAGAPPLGSIVTALPGGCATTAISGVQYNDCGGVYYRTAFQGNNLVYVVAQP